MRVREGTTEMCNDAWSRVRHVTFDVDYFGSVCGRVRTLLATGLPQVNRSTQDDLNGTCRKLIRAMFAAMIRRVVVFEVCGSSTAATAGLEPKDNGWETSKVQRRETATTTTTAEAMLRMSSTNKDKTAK